MDSPQNLGFGNAGLEFLVGVVLLGGEVEAGHGGVSVGSLGRLSSEHIHGLTSAGRVGLTSLEPRRSPRRIGLTTLVAFLRYSISSLNRGRLRIAVNPVSDPKPIVSGLLRC